MKVYKHPKTGLMTIWYGEILEQYMFCSLKDAIKQFKQAHNLKCKAEIVNYSPLFPR
jgi:hypothetical protein